MIDHGRFARLIEHFNSAFIAALSPTENQSIDERKMVKFKRQSVMKQYIKGKPLQREFKHWCRNNRDWLISSNLSTGRK